MANISCGNCGATHSSVAEVKRCHTTMPTQDTPTQDTLTQDTPTQDTPSPADQRSQSTPEAGPGPDALGRSVLVRPGAETPQGWEHARRISVATVDIDADTVVELHRAWMQRERLVIEATGEIPEPRAISYGAIWELDPGLDLSADRLQFLLSANVVDHREGLGVWAPLARAAAIGGTIGEHGDISLPNGSEVWLDGGPFGLQWEDGVGVVHANQLEVGVLPTGRSAQPLPAIALAPDQLRAVHHGAGPARIIAPAGSGKTRVLTERARHLLGTCAFPPSALTLVAFNKRAQLEMKQRTADLAGLRVQTLNALGLAILRGTKPFLRSELVEDKVEVITEQEVRGILDGLLDLRRRANIDQLAPWIDALSAVRLGLRDPAEVERSFGGDVDGLGELVVRYRKELRRRGLVDFDEQIVGAIEVLLADPEARAAAQRTCRALLVDEFQDLTPAHLLLIRLLAAPGFDVFGVGDDDQTIYGFTGAKPDWLIDYRRWFPEATHLALEINYRCPPDVVSAAATLLTHNLRRVDKVISAPAERVGVSGAGDLDVIGTDDTIGETRRRIGELTNSGVDPQNIIVLTRVNAALAPVQVGLAIDGVAVEQAVGDSFLNRSGVRAVLAWIRLACTAGRFDPVDIEAAARRPSRGLSPRVVEWMSEQGDINGLRRLAKRIKERDAGKVDAFVDDMGTLIAARTRGSSTSELIEIVRDDIGLASSLDALDASRRSVNRSSHSDDLKAMLALGRLQPEAHEFEGWLRKHLARPGDPDGVRLSTIHRVKGREWPHVIVVGVDAGSLPHRLSTDVEEERRVFHVAITRATTSTAVVFAASEASVFIGQLAEAYDPSKQQTVVAVPATLTAASEHNADLDDSLRDVLKVWRSERSRREGVPAYVVFNDKTLDDLLVRKPLDLTELARCHGIGPAKMDRFGDELLGVLSEVLP